jgi:hypothetical protein
VRSCAWSTGRLFAAESNFGTWLSDGTFAQLGDGLMGVLAA